MYMYILFRWSLRVSHGSFSDQSRKRISCLPPRLTHCPHSGWRPVRETRHEEWAQGFLSRLFLAFIARASFVKRTTCCCAFSGVDRSSNEGYSPHSLGGDDVSVASGHLSPVPAARMRRKSIFPASSNLLGVQHTPPGIVISSASNSDNEDEHTGEFVYVHVRLLGKYSSVHVPCCIFLLCFLMYFVTFCNSLSIKRNFHWEVSFVFLPKQVFVIAIFRRVFNLFSPTKLLRRDIKVIPRPNYQQTRKMWTKKRVFT